jgi:hypothetical protein
VGLIIDNILKSQILITITITRKTVDKTMRKAFISLLITSLFVIQTSPSIANDANTDESFGRVIDMINQLSDSQINELQKLAVAFSPELQKMDQKQLDKLTKNALDAYKELSPAQIEDLKKQANALMPEIEKLSQKEIDELTRELVKASKSIDLNQIDTTQKTDLQKIKRDLKKHNKQRHNQ